MSTLIILGCIIAGIIALYFVVALVFVIVGAVAVVREHNRISKRNKDIRIRVQTQGRPFTVMEHRTVPRNLMAVSR